MYREKQEPLLIEIKKTQGKTKEKTVRETLETSIEELKYHGKEQENNEIKKTQGKTKEKTDRMTLKTLIGKEE